MRDLYVIIHESNIDLDIKLGNLDARGVKQEIQKLRSRVPLEDIFEITGYNFEFDGLPNHLEKIRVFVLGAWKDECVKVAYQSLKKRSYNVDYYHPGILVYKNPCSFIFSS